MLVISNVVKLSLHSEVKRNKRKRNAKIVSDTKTARNKRR